MSLNLPLGAVRRSASHHGTVSVRVDCIEFPEELGRHHTEPEIITAFCSKLGGRIVTRGMNAKTGLYEVHLQEYTS